MIKLFDYLMPETAMDSPLLKCCFGDLSQDAVSLDVVQFNLPEQYSESSGSTERNISPSQDSIDSTGNADVTYLEQEDALFQSSVMDDVERKDMDIELDDVLQQKQVSSDSSRHVSKKSLVILVFALTLHHLPEGIALGFAFGGSGQSYTVQEAVVLAIALAIQAFPEGIAVAVPLHRSGVSKAKSFMFGSISGSVEVIGALPGAGFALVFQSILPYCLAFAGGAMMYVVISELLPNAIKTKSPWGIWGALFGFTLMMALDSGLGALQPSNVTPV